MITGRKLATALCLLMSGYALVVRPRLVRWGAADEEVERSYPGADLIPGGDRSATMAVTIDAPPSQVWPWLVQMGANRAGWYSWDHLDNWGRASAEQIHPEWQVIAIGDHLSGSPDGSQWWEVAALEPERFLGLRASYDLRLRPFAPTGTRPRFYTDSLWGFLLEELPGRRTRLLVSGYWSLRPRWLQAAVASGRGELHLPGALPLDHADPSVRQPEAACGARFGAGAKGPGLRESPSRWYRLRW